MNKGGQDVQMPSTPEMASSPKWPVAVPVSPSSSDYESSEFAESASEEDTADIVLDKNSDNYTFSTA
jgi:hypothetical protein